MYQVIRTFLKKRKCSDVSIIIACVQQTKQIET